MASLFRFATSDQKRRVLGILDLDVASLQRGSKIALIGLRGAGKSTLGRMAAKALGIPFVELNAEIEASTGIYDGVWSGSTYTACGLIAVAKMEIRTLRLIKLTAS